MATELNEILANFDFLDDWEDRYRYVIELGKELEDFPSGHKTDANKVRGCVSQVWLTMDCERDASGAVRLTFSGDSDALIVRGLVRIMLALFNGKTAQEIIDCDVDTMLQGIGLRSHLTPQRSNGLSAMVARMKQDAREVLAS